jgi:hypothetical protein
MLIYPTINQKKLIDANLRNNLRATIIKNQIRFVIWEKF